MGRSATSFPRLAARRPSRRLPALVVAAALAVSACLVGIVATEQPAEARPAEQGLGRFGDAIDWVEWGGYDEPLPNGGFTGTTSRTIGGETLTVTCTASNIASSQGGNDSALRAYAPGSFEGDALDDMYNIGGTGYDNQLINGLANTGFGSRVTFEFDCDATLDDGVGAPVDVPLDGLVFADAEQSNSDVVGQPDEYVAATPTPAGSGTFRVIDRYRDADCPTSTLATRSAGNRLQLAGPPAPKCASGPATVAFIDGATSAQVELQGGGFSAIGLGVVLNTDFGDAPQSYGSAGHIASFNFTGGTVPVGSTPTLISNDDFALGAATAPGTRLGVTLDPEAAPFYSDDAEGDDEDLVPAFGNADDERAVPEDAPITRDANNDVTLSIVCGNPGPAIAGWIDFDLNGTFDADERSDDSVCGAGNQATVTWTDVPTSVDGLAAGSPSFLRLRTAATQAQIADPTGFAPSGEAEDHRVVLDLGPTLRTTLEVPQRAFDDDVLRIGVLDEDGDEVFGANTGATPATQDSADTGARILEPGQTYTVFSDVVSGPGGPEDYDQDIACTQAGGGVVAATPVAGEPGQWTVGPFASAAEVTCDVTSTGYVPALTLDKTVDGVSDPDNNGLDAGDTITYSYEVENTGNIALSNLVFDETQFSGTGNLNVVCPAATQDPAGPYSLAAGQTKVCAADYVVTQADADAGGVTNTATARASVPNSNLPVAVSAPSAAPDQDVPVAADPITLTRDFDINGDGDQLVEYGESISYTYLVTNSGNRTLTGVTVTDPQAGPVSCNPVPTTLAPGESAICSADAPRVVTNADIYAGTIDSTATASGTFPGGAEVTDSAPQDIPTVAADAEVELAVAVAREAGRAADAPLVLDEDLTYTWLVQNTGNVALDDVDLEQALAGATDAVCEAGPLLPGDTLSCTSTYTVTQADVDDGEVVNTGTVTATPPSAPAGSQVTATATAETPAPPNPALTVDLAGAISGGGQSAVAGDTVTYRALVTNTGNEPLSNVSVVSTGTPGIGASTCAQGFLIPGASTTCTFTTPRPVTQADVDAQANLEASVQARGTFVRENETVTATDTESTPVRAANPSLTTTVSSDPAGTVREGQTITYTVTVTNTGNVTLGTPDDPTWNGPGALTCPDRPAQLAPGEDFVCTATYTVDADDVAAGEIVASASTASTDPAGNAAPPSSGTARNTVAEAPSIVISDIAVATRYGNDNRPDAGDALLYTVTVTNNGDTTLTDVAVTGLPGSSCTPTTLSPTAPGNVATCTATYPLTQGDIDNGSVDPVLTASGQPPVGTPTTDSDDLSTALAPDPELTVDPVTADPIEDTDQDGRVDAGDTVAYSFTVTNTGNVTLDPVTVAGPGFTNVSCGDARLLPGQSTTCTAIYTLTQADVDRGSADPVLTATGTPPVGPEITGDGSLAAPIAIDRDRGIAVTVSPSTTDAVEQGDTVTFTVGVRNTGTTTVTLSSVTSPDLQGLDCDLPVTLAPGKSLTCTTDDITVTAADAAAGVIERSATASGTSAGEPVDDEGTGQIVVSNDPALDVTLTAGPIVDNDQNGVDRGDTVTYTVRIENTGDVTLDPVTASGIPGLQCPPGALAPGQVRTCEVTYELTQDDVDAGSLDPSVTVDGTPPRGPAVSATATLDEPIDFTGDSELTTELIGTLDTDNADDLAEAGDTITYTVRLTNTGDTTLSDVGVAAFGYGAVSCPDTTLAPGASTVCTVARDRTVSQADVDAGQPLVATATGRATAPAGQVDGVTDTDSASQPVAAADGALQVTLRPRPAGEVQEGDTIRYDVVLSNTGNVTLTVGTVGSPDLGPITCPGARPWTIAPGDTLVCSAAPYTVTPADVAAGSVDREVNETVTTPGGVEIDGTDAVSSPVDDSPGIEVTLTAGPVVDVNGNGLDVGDEITYTVVVQNTGTVSLDPVDLVGAAGLEGLQCSDAPLAAGDSRTCTLVYELTQDDIDRGTLDPTVEATGTEPAGTQVSDEASLADPIVLDGTSSLSVDLVGVLDTDNPNGNAEAGSTITYTVRVTNTGDTTLTGVQVADFGYGEVTCDPTTLAPGDSTVCTVEEQRVVTQDEVDAGDPLTATATATATAPAGAPGAVTDSDTDTQDVVNANPQLEVVKAATPDDANGNGRLDPGETITYSFTVNNTGNIAIDGVTVDDPMVGAVACSPTTLEPEESAQCTAAPYTVTQADLDRGSVTNTAGVDGVPPRGDLDATGDTLRTPIAVLVAQVLTKTADLRDTNGNGVADAGETIAYSFTVRNTGTQTLTGVTVDDPSLGSVTCPAGDVAPGDSITCTGDEERLVTQDDIDAGVDLVNVATSTATTRGGAEAEGSDSASVPVADGVAELTITKTAVHDDTDADGRLDVGETIQYSFLVENTGNIRIDDIAVDDPMLTGITCEATSLDGGESASCTADAPYRITQADVDAGEVTNSATASGQPADGTGPITSDPDTVVTDGPSSGAIRLVKRGRYLDRNNNDAVDPGEKVLYTFRVTNTGDVDVTGVRISDLMLKRAGIRITCDTRRLAPGESTECTASGRYTVTDADVQKPRLRNVATASGFAGLDRVISRAVTYAPTDDDPSNDAPAGNPGGGYPGGGSSSPISDGKDGILPSTGGPAIGAAVLALIMLLGGFVLVRRSRRRQV